MTQIFGYNVSGQMNLQSTLASTSANGVFATPHHPITCNTELLLHEDGTMECQHHTVKGDRRTQTCIDHSIAILIFEEAYKKFG